MVEWFWMLAKNYLSHGIIIMAFFASEKLFQFTNIIV